MDIQKQIGKLVNTYGVELGGVSQLQVSSYVMYEVEFPFSPIVFHSLEDAREHASLYGFGIILRRAKTTRLE